MAESFCCPPETITTLLMAMAQYIAQDKSQSLKKNKKTPEPSTSWFDEEEIHSMWREHSCPHTPFSDLPLMSVSFLPLSPAQEVDKSILHLQEEERVAHLLGSTFVRKGHYLFSWNHMKASQDCKQADSLYSWCPRMKLSNWREIRNSERNMV